MDLPLMARAIDIALRCTLRELESPLTLTLSPFGGDGRKTPYARPIAGGPGNRRRR